MKVSSCSDLSPLTIELWSYYYFSASTNITPSLACLSQSPTLTAFPMHISLSLPPSLSLSAKFRSIYYASLFTPPSPSQHLMPPLVFILLYLRHLILPSLSSAFHHALITLILQNGGSDPFFFLNNFLFLSVKKLVSITFYFHLNSSSPSTSPLGVFCQRLNQQVIFVSLTKWFWHANALGNSALAEGEKRSAV